MAIPWRVALKVIPWGDVIEHAPKVLNAARKLMDRQRTQAPEPEPSAKGPVAADALTPLDEVRKALDAAQARLERHEQNQRELIQTVTELAEQNARLVNAVAVLRLRSRLMMTALLVLLVWLGVLTWRF